MKKQIKESIQRSINALNGKKEEGDDVFVLDTIQQLYKELYVGSGLGIGCTHKDYRDSWETYRVRFCEHYSFIDDVLTWKDALLVLFDSANLNSSQMLEYAQKVENPIMYNHVLIHIVENLVAEDKIEQAHEYTQLFRPTLIFKHEDNLDKGYRIILRYYAQKSDKVNFFKIFKLSKPREDRSEMDLIKIVLVESVTKTEGIEAGLNLCKHKNLGERYYYNLLSVYAMDGKYSELKELFFKYPQLKQEEKETELNILGQAYLAASKKGIEIEAEFDDLFERAKNVDPKLKWGDAKLRDSILFDLGLASLNDKVRLALCKKAIKSNWLKKELIVK